MDSPMADDLPDLKYYAGVYCKSCQELDKMKFEAQYDDDDYLEPDDDFEGDDTLKLHVINYRRNSKLNGRFVFTCPPWYRDLGTGPHSREHYRIEPDFDETIKYCGIFAVYQYNLAHEDAELDFVGVDDAAVEGRIMRVIYMILRCRDDSSPDDDDGGDGKRKRSSGGPGCEKTFRVVVSCCWWKKWDMQVLVFKDYTSWESLLPAHPRFDELTKPMPRRDLASVTGHPPKSRRDPLSLTGHPGADGSVESLCCQDSGACSL